MPAAPMIVAGNRGIPVSSCTPRPAPSSSARSVAIATISAPTQALRTTQRGAPSRMCSGRLRPLTRPSFADCVWITIAARFAATTTHTSS